MKANYNLIKDFTSRFLILPIDKTALRVIVYLYYSRYKLRIRFLFAPNVGNLPPMRYNLS